MGEIEYGKGMIFCDGIPLGVGTLEYVEEEVETIDADDVLPAPYIMGGTVTFSADIDFLDPDGWEKMIGKYRFAREAAIWACEHRKDLFYRCRNSKRLRIHMKYYKYIIRAYKDFLRGNKK